MNILGIIAFGMNPAACLLKDGKCVAFVEEERFSRIKVSEGMFPAKSVAYCLSQENLNLGSIDRIAFGWDVKKYPWIMASNFTNNYLRYFLGEKRSFHKQKECSSFWLGMEGLTDYHPVKIRLKIIEGLRSIGLKGNIPKIEFVPHHLAHAYSSYFCSNFNKAGILTIDGHGEEICTQLSIGEGNEVKIVKSLPIPHSLGWFYAAITEYLGFIPYRDEGKVMGLAAYGECRKNNNKWIEPLSKILRIKKDHYEVNPLYTLFGGHYYGKRYTDQMVRLVTDIDKEAHPISYGEKIEIKGSIQSKYLLDKYIDIAWAAQELLERAGVMLARNLIKDYDLENLCIAGGVGLNCKMNGEILRQTGCKNIFVQPASNDAGTAMGAAMYIAQRLGDNIRNTFSVYLGPQYSNEEIHSTLKDCKLDFIKVDKPDVEAARLLQEGKIIGWFQGRMELGPRALGDRSILANPRLSGIKDRVNKEVKYRENWRPFCPSILDEEKNNYIKNPKEASFMTIAYDMKEEKKKELNSVVHIDGTIRPQAVTKENNPLYYSLIYNLGKISGHPIVLNTSFNIRGEPIVSNLLEAIRCFYSNGLDALIIGNFLLKK
ncbi:MAG: carbamoyltransferase C-terminal domain-containing protein [Candidatus Omnitrophica bacterium]|nr:carbamoyltransferase C-terminal domain-containing protein [Candidatus Omnitrophota bacterium]